MQGKIDRVSGAVTCQDRRDPLGVVVSIVPFNFPFMVSSLQIGLDGELVMSSFCTIIQ